MYLNIGDNRSNDVPYLKNKTYIMQLNDFVVTLNIVNYLF